MVSKNQPDRHQICHTSEILILVLHKMSNPPYAQVNVWSFIPDIKVILPRGEGSWMVY